MEWFFLGFGFVFLVVSLSSFAVFGFVIYLIARRIHDEGLLDGRDDPQKFRTRDEPAHWECRHCGRRNPDELHECDSCGAPANSET